MDLFLAGGETTSTVMNWIILYLTLYPEVQVKARKEILRTSENGMREIHLSDTNG